MAVGRWRARDLLPVAIICLVCGAASFYAPRLIPFFAVAEQWLVDLRVAYVRPAEPQRQDIVLVTITEETLATLAYRSPVDRAFLADTLQWLDDAGVAAIGVDLLFDQATEAEKDGRLRQVLQGMHAPTVLAWADAADGLQAPQSKFLAAYLYGLQKGYVTLLTDRYLDVVRWIYPGRAWQGTMIEGFPEAVARAARHPVTVDERLPLAYREPPDRETPAFRTFAAHLLPLLPKAWFAGKIVLIGVDLPREDRHRTPATTDYRGSGDVLPGVAVHAHAVAQLIDGRKAPSISPLTDAVTVGVVTLAAMVIAALNLSVPVHTVVGALSFAFVWAAGTEMYALTGILVPLVTPSLAFAFTFAAGNAWWRGRSHRQSAFIQDAFSRFTSPAVVQALINDPQRLRLGGEKRVISCLFTDVAGFTSWLEQTDPERALATLNDYLNGMVRIAFEHDGTINKLIGDALVVLFGAPVDQHDHPARAVRCALAMDAFARAYATSEEEKGGWFGDTRIGVHTGPAIVGNFGGERFFDYTAYGDTVNTASRLESANKHLGTLICVSGAVASQCDGIAFRPIGALIAVGKSEAVDVFEPLPPGAPALAHLQKYLEAYERLQEHQPCARDAFATLAATDPSDGLVRFHAGRLANGESGCVLRLAAK
jgi:Adenylate cyclase, family 3 (some proteins contain HAMP domain)